MAASFDYFIYSQTTLRAGSYEPADINSLSDKDSLDINNAYSLRKSEVVRYDEV